VAPCPSAGQATLCRTLLRESRSWPGSWDPAVCAASIAGTGRCGQLLDHCCALLAAVAQAREPAANAACPRGASSLNAATRAAQLTHGTPPLAVQLGEIEGTSRKFTACWEGPFKVTEACGTCGG
jgi:hypothetical protein